ncbi:SusC/RagA family TonB-linked outer membrane protein [Parapedobacter tibetensis]|uniref:SusC/RagA family TonB-linked outer membrane protein n=1 Tax=Parapedobacter tibetensis TaxID=2972951 RepID=UPI00214DB98B|nr:SusC/RagA family TonB-linked outer membrane protein [Parapedobacter tibetensis]
MKIIMFLLFGGFLSVSASSYSQSITFKGTNIPFADVITVVRNQTGYTVFSAKSLLEEAKPITVDVSNMSLRDFLETIIANQPIAYQLEDKTISLSRKPVVSNSSGQPVVSHMVRQQATITGRVIDADTGEPMAGVTVQIKEEKIQTLTDDEGRYRLAIPQHMDQPILVFSFVGRTPTEISYTGQQTINVFLKPDVETIKDVVVTGIYQRQKESFSGSSATYTAKDLQVVGNQNVLQSLKTLDPSFAIIDNNQFGSDPNRLPDIEIRGKSSVIGLTEEFGTNPNQPLFILDGFESTLAIISDLSMDRVESITLLKDAAATAIYGSKAANGVVVVETKRPVAGQLRINYNLNSSVSFADLMDYNLMNAEEKLQFELLSEHYGFIDENNNIIRNAENEVLYYERLKEVRRGVNTYWASEPLRTGLFHRHTLFAEGGDDNLRYSASLNYGNNNGVMKGSSRQTTNGNVRLMYRKGRLSVSNSLSIDYINANRETVPFSQFSRANPYHRKYNAEGGMDKVLDAYEFGGITVPLVAVNNYNPLYDLNNHNVNQQESQGFTNNFELDWRMVDALRVRARIGIRRFTDHDEIFNSPFNSQFEGVDDLRKGTYEESNSKRLNYDGDLSLTYGKLLADKHMVNAVGGMRMEQASTQQSAYRVEGFVDDDFANPNFAFGYPEGSRSDYQRSMRRGASFFMNAGYAYDQRILVDATVRSDGSSIYGSTRQFTTIWSAGLGWNIHNEPFLKNASGNWFSQLRLRGSIGNPGNQNFDDYISMRIYRYNNENRNPFGASVILNDLGNSNLQWQKTLDRNVGIDVTTLNDRLRINFDYFVKNTDPLLVFVALPSSSGTNRVAQNIGEQITRGFTGMADYTLLRRQQLNWRVNLNMRQLKAEYQNMGNRLNNFNEANQSRNLVRYYDGGSPSDLWAVRSLGIDPATGREVFLNKNNEQTFVHNYADEVVVGNSEPTLEGIIGTSFFYKGFLASVNLRYRLGGQVFMQTLYEKVENITNVNAALNQDKRALYERWQKPGDNAQFKAISTNEITPISSRFVEDNNMLIGESFSLGYETTNAAWLRAIRASSITFRTYMNDIFYVATVTNERGIDYPFARSVSFSAAVRF